MNLTEQGVQRLSKLLRLCSQLCLLSILCLSQITSAETLTNNNSTPVLTTQKHHAYIIYPKDNALYSNIAKKISENIKENRSDIIVTKVEPQEKINVAEPNTDIIIAIGRASMHMARKNHGKTKKLFITTDPNKHTVINKSDSVLYMTQSYCQQMKLIRLLNQRWKTISIISSSKKPINSSPIQQCAKKYGFTLYIANTNSEQNQTNTIKQALRHADVLLALPDSSIYNSRTVKNILLTSYRYRRPVIAFSKNFVSAGALASIHSNTDQIAHSASKLIQQYFDSNILQAKNYPDGFDININKQVFRALDLATPDLTALKNSLLQKNKKNTEEQP